MNVVVVLIGGMLAGAVLKLLFGNHDMLAYFIASSLFRVGDVTGSG